MHVRRSLSLLLALSVFAGSSLAANAADRLSVVADEWPPFSGASLPGQGISIDVITAVLTRAGYNVDAQIVPWARIMNGSRNDEYDVVGSLFYDESIAEYMTYGDPFYQTSVKFVQRMGASHDVSSLTALEPYSIAVGDGFLYEEAFDRADHLNKVVVTTALQAVQMVAFDRVDLTLDSEEVVQYALKNGVADLTERVEIMPHILAQHDVHMAVRNSLPNKDKVVADFNRVLEEMRADGSLKAILAKHR